MRWALVIAAGVLVLSVECGSLGCGSDEDREAQPRPETATGTIDGLVIGSQPVGQATVEVWTLDDRGRRAQEPLYTAHSDEQGRFQLAIQDLPLPFAVTARGGTTSEYWSEETLPLDDQIHLQAVVTRWGNGQIEATEPVVVSPFTTIAQGLAVPRLSLLWEPTYAAAVERAQALLDAHVGIALGRVFPVLDMERVLTAETRHGLALIGLSSLAHDFAVRSGRSILAMNIVTLTRALTSDARASQAVLDGTDTNGIIEFEGCAPACILSANTLRGDLARALIARYLPSERNAARLEFGDVAGFLYHMAENDDPGLFDPRTPPDGIDRSAPVVEMLSSPVLDESLDIISFETGDAGPRTMHFHDPAAVVDLATGASGLDCPTMFKHSNTLHRAEDNPLRWRFAVRDDLIGTAHTGIEARLRLGKDDDAPVMPLMATPVRPLASGGFEYEVTALRSAVPELATEEGWFRLELRAMDLLGNVSGPFTSCLSYVSLAAPQKVGVPRIVNGPGSFRDIDLVNDELPSLLGGKVSPAEGRVLASFDVDNPSDDAVYLTMDIEAIEGTYESTWIEARAFLREDFDTDQCHVIYPYACSTKLPREPRRERRSGVQPLPRPGRPGSFLDFHVIDKQTGAADRCAECNPGEVRLAPRRSYQVQVMVTSLDFLLPSGVDGGQIFKIMVGPPDDQKQLTGILEPDEYNWCVFKDPMNPLLCVHHEFFQLYQALTHARIDIHSLRMQGRTSPAPARYPRIPRPALDGQDDTFAEPIVTSYPWSAEENEELPPQNK